MKKNGYRWLAGLTLFLLVGLVCAGSWTPNQFIYKPAIGARGETEHTKFNTGMERVDSHLGTQKTLGDPGHATLAEALATIGSSKVTLTIPAGTVSISSDTTIPSNVHVRALQGGVFSVADGKTLTINGTIDAGLYQIFSWAGTMLLSGEKAAKLILKKLK